MTGRGRGRGRGTLSMWGEASKPRRELRVVGSPANSVLPISRKEIKNEPDGGQNDSHVRVTHIIDVEHFWAQIGSLDDLKDFDRYMLSLNLWCNEQQKSGDLQIPQFGQPVCVRHKDTSQWRRAQVTRLSDDMVDVFYLDYGQSECVSLDRICHSTPGDILSRRAMAQYATLDGVQPVGESWSNEANKRFSELVSAMGDKLTAQFIDSFRARLYLRNGSGFKVAVSDVLISEGLAQHSHNSLGSGSWRKDDCHKAKPLNSEEQKKLDEQWNSLKLLPPTSRESAWSTGTAFTTNKDQLSFNTGQQFRSYLPFPQEDTSNTLVQMNCDEMKDIDNTNKTSLGNVPPSLKLDWFEQSGDNLETFNVKSIDPGPVEVLRSTRPHLASPSEFLSHTRGHDSGLCAVQVTDVKDEPSPKYQPPHLRNASKNINGIPGKNSEHQLESFTSSSQSNHSSFLKQDDKQSPFSNFTFSPKLGRSLIAAQFQTVSKKEDMTGSFQPQQQKPVETFSQPEFLKVQPLNETTRDEKLRAELEWKIWKFRRNISGLLNKIVSTKIVDFAAELDKHIANSRISQEFPGISEMSIILSLLLEKALEGDKFHSAAVKVCIALTDMDSLEFSAAFGKAVSECQDSLMEQCSVSDCYKRCKRFSSFIGKLYLEVLPDTSDSSFKSSLDGIVANSLHRWLSFDQAELLDIHRLNALCLKTFLELTGPVIDQTEGNEISRYFATIRELVLSPKHDKSVKSTLLDILLLRASGWKAEGDWDEQQEAVSEFTEDEVPSENEFTEEQQQVETGDQSKSAEWDPYSKVRVMLKNLKLEGLLPKFFENCIRDSLLSADWEELKTTLKEAAFPPGVILEIRMYLEKGPRPTTDIKPASSADVIQEVKPKAPKSPSSTNSAGHNIEINKLNQELQQLMMDESQEKGLQKTSPTRQISRPPEQVDHEGTPYSRPVTRKYVSKPERRYSSELRGDELSKPVKDPVKSVPFTSDTTEPKNVGTSSETSKEQKQPVSTKSYSAVLKNVSSEAKPGEKAANQSKTLSRPPPGFTTLPTHGGDNTMRMTVLGATKSMRRATGPSSSAPGNTHGRSDSSMNWRIDSRGEQSMQSGIPPQQQQQKQQQSQKQRQSGHAVKWQQFGDFMQNNPPRTESFDEGPQRSGTPTETSGNTSFVETTEVPPVVQPHRAFGPGGLKACVICGSKEHLRCNDRSKFFVD